MNRTFTGFTLVAALLVCGAAFAQTQTASNAAPAPAASSPSAPVAAPSKVGIIRIQDAIISTNEGKRDFDALGKKFEPKQSELQKAQQKIEEDRKQLQAQGDKMNDEARAKLQKQIEIAAREFQHNMETAQQDFQGEQNELANKIGQKLMQVLDKYAKDNGYAVILDVSSPQSPVLWANLASVDVTDAIVNLYNAQSGVPAPAPAAAAPRPAAPRPAAPATANPPKKP